MKSKNPSGAHAPARKGANIVGCQASSAAGKAGWRKLFLGALAEMPNISAACQKARISRSLAYDARESSKTFRAQWEESLQRGIERLEEECWKRATIGVKKGVWMKDKDGAPIKVEEVTEFSDSLAALLLRAHMPAKYREKFQAEISGVNGKPIAVEELAKPAKPPIDYARMGELTRELLGFPPLNQSAESHTPPPANGHNGHTNGTL